MYIGLLFLSLSAWAAQSDFLKPLDVMQDTSEKKVLIFLSDKCPCSKAHVEHLNMLSEKHKSISFFGVISEPVQEKNKFSIKKYFKEKDFSFPIVRDDQQVLVKKYKALKTPHVTFLEKSKILYQGGVTNKKSFKDSSKKFLAENLNLVTSGKTVKYKTGASLGCYIRRY
jgi:hypothetical protein